jgi:hypothetical protein
VDPGPLPPHERPWRHPSELPPPAHEPTSVSGRLLILSSATLSLLLVGLLAVAVTPGRSPATVSQATTPSGPTASPPMSLAGIRSVDLPRATPVLDGRLALTTLDATAAVTDWVDVVLPSGRAVRAEVLSTESAGGIAVVALPDATEPAVELAAGSLVPTDTVFVDGPEPTVIAISDLRSLDVGDGTPVLDAEGALLGLCYRRDGRMVELVAVDTIPDVVVPTSSTVPVETTVPVTGPPPTTTTPSASTPVPTTAVDATTVPATTLPTTTEPPVTDDGATPSTG